MWWSSSGLIAAMHCTCSDRQRSSCSSDVFKGQLCQQVVPGWWAVLISRHVHSSASTAIGTVSPLSPVWVCKASPKKAMALLGHQHPWSSLQSWEGALWSSVGMKCYSVIFGKDKGYRRGINMFVLKGVVVLYLFLAHGKGMFDEGHSEWWKSLLLISKRGGAKENKTTKKQTPKTTYLSDLAGIL